MVGSRAQVHSFQKPQDFPTIHVSSQHLTITDEDPVDVDGVVRG